MRFTSRHQLSASYIRSLFYDEGETFNELSRRLAKPSTRMGIIHIP